MDPLPPNQPQPTEPTNLTAPPSTSPVPLAQPDTVTSQAVTTGLRKSKFIVPSVLLIAILGATGAGAYYFKKSDSKIPFPAFINNKSNNPDSRAVSGTSGQASLGSEESWDSYSDIIDGLTIKFPKPFKVEGLGKSAMSPVILGLAISDGKARFYVHRNDIPPSPSDGPQDFHFDPTIVDNKIVLGATAGDVDNQVKQKTALVSKGTEGGGGGFSYKNYWYSVGGTYPEGDAHYRELMVKVLSTLSFIEPGSIKTNPSSIEITKISVEGLSLQYPKNWTVHEKLKGYVGIYPPDTTPPSTANGHVLAQVAPLKNPEIPIPQYVYKDPSDYIRREIENIARRDSSTQTLETKSASLGGYEGQRAIVLSKGIKTLLIVAFDTSGNYILIRFDAPTAKFDTYLTDVEKIAASLTVK